MVQQILAFKVLKSEIPTLFVSGIKGEGDSLQLVLSEHNIFINIFGYVVKDWVRFDIFHKEAGRNNNNKKNNKEANSTEIGKEGLNV